MRSVHVILVLASASQALKAERSLRASGTACALMPVPRTVSSQCGVCLRVASGDRVEAEAILAGCGIRIAAIHELDAPASGRARPREKEA